MIIKKMYSIKAFILFFALLMLAGFCMTGEAGAAVTLLDNGGANWSAHTEGTGAITAHTYTAPAGTDRAVIVVVTAEGGPPSITSVTVGGVAATQIATISQNVAYIWIGYRLIGTSASTTSANIAVTWGTPPSTDSAIQAATYGDVRQTAGQGSGNTINSIATGSSGSYPVTTANNVFNAAGGAVNNALNGRVIYAHNANGGSADNQTTTGTSAAWTFTEMWDVYVTSNRSSSGHSDTAAGSGTVSVTSGTGTSRTVLVAFALNEEVPASPNGVLAFTSATFSESEAVGTTVTTTVSRTGGSTGIVSIDCNTVAGGTATAGSDYTNITPQTLTWAAGDTANKTCAIPITNDILYEGNETVNLTLTNATGGATIGTQNTAVLTIADNDPLPTGTPILLNHTYAGNYDFVGTGGTLRTESNTGNACAVTTSDSAALSGIPAGATVVSAHLYWVGSMQTPGNEDYNITFDGNNLTADNQHQELFVYGGDNLFYFGAEEDVTSIVAPKKNGTYTFSNLTVYNGAPHCTPQAVVAGWSLVVIYQDLITPAPLRVINIYDGFEYFQSSQIILTPTNFQVPTGTAYTDYDGKHAHVSWEGDETNSGTSGGFSEGLTFQGNNLTDAYNPSGNQFNSTMNFLGSSTSYGVDFDIYDATPYLTGGETSVTTRYSSGQDLVLLSAEIISVRNTPVADLEIVKSHTGDFIVGQVESFNIDVSNNGPSNETNTITVTDILPAGLTLDSWSGTNWSHPTATTWTYNNTVSSGASAPTLTLNVLVGSSAYPGVNNTASVSSPTFDNVSSNDSSTDSVTVKRSSLITSTKTVVDLNGGFADPGDTIRYTINIKENGGVDATNVSVTDNMPANVTGFTVIGIPAGATNSSSPAPAGSNSTGYLNVTGFTVAANNTVTVIFDVAIAGGTPGGTLINNTATVNNPNGPGATPAAPTVVVSETIPGNKQLYFQAPDSENSPTQPQNMNRTPLTSTPTPSRVRIQREDTPRVWAQTPVLQSPLTITGNMSVTLQLRRDTNINDRPVRVTVDYLPGPVTVGVTDLTLSGATLSDTVTKSFTFPITIIPATPLTLPTGAQLRVTVDNEPGAGTGRSIYVYPYDSATGNTTRLEMDVTTVIDVNSVNFYNAAYPGGSLLTNAVPNTTVYIRSVVSDPFGSFDITGAKIDIINPNLSTVVSGASMTQVADSGAASKTYQYQYTLPSAGPIGFWTANVTSTEGTEGTIIDTNFGLIKVVLPDIIMMKTSTTEWDPVNEYGGDGTEPKSIPGADVIYTIQATNTGEGAVDNNTVIITDPVPANTKLYVDNYGGSNGCGPFEFINGSPTSGLTCSFTSLGSVTDDLDFSNTASPGPYVYNYTPVSTGGYDPLVTSIRINPKGIFNGTGGGNPYFRIKFRVRVN
ncbi:MAG: Calx-beta domain-containing protein [Thermodesulfovibrionia bacterium]|nr:Calx-beta domain-containing protein [Thermodesulfovibrionia bacterium]